MDEVTIYGDCGELPDGEYLSAFSRRHYTRLRHYWHGKARGAASLTDGIDLDLAAAGLINRLDSPSATIYFAITDAGVRELAIEHRREVARRRPHHELAGRLASWLRDQGRVTWENIELLAQSEQSRQCVRPDVFSLVATYNEKKINPVIHEVKVSRQDFLSDLAAPEKRAGYAKLSEALYYVAPLGMIAKDEVPSECGLVVEEDTGKFVVIKRAKKKKCEVTAHHFMNLILKPGKFNPL